MSAGRIPNDGIEEGRQLGYSVGHINVTLFGGGAKEERNKTKGSPGERPRVWFQSFPCGGGIDSTTFKEDREGRREWRRRWGRFLKPPTLGGQVYVPFRVEGFRRE